MNKENLDYIKYKFQDKDSEFYSWEYEILRDNDKSINNIKIRYQSITKKILNN